MKTKIYLAAIIVGIGILMLLPTLTMGLSMNDNGTTGLSGYYGDPPNYGETLDPWTNGEIRLPAYHPEIDAYEDYVGVVFVTESGNCQYVRLALSSNCGSSWTFYWVDTSNQNIIQDYPDIQIYHDYKTNNDKVVVVWQEMPLAGGDWDIKVAENVIGTTAWSIQTITNDGYDDIYPKIAVESYDDPGDGDATYWNVVWQNESSSYPNRFGIDLWRYINDDQGTVSYTTSLNSPASFDDDYKEPAIDCLLRNENCLDIYIVFDEFHQNQNPDDKIMFIHGYYTGRGAITWSGNGVAVRTTTLGDGSLGWPDVSVTTPSAGPNNIVDVVWTENDGTNDIGGHDRSTNGGASFNNYLQITNDAETGWPPTPLRHIAVDSFTQGNNVYCAVMWTTSNDVYYRISTNGQFPPGRQSAGVMDPEVENFVDIAMYESSNQIYTYGTWQVDGTAVFFGYDNDL